MHAIWLVGKELFWYALVGASGSEEPFKGDGSSYSLFIDYDAASTEVSAGTSTRGGFQLLSAILAICQGAGSYACDIFLGSDISCLLSGAIAPCMQMLCAM